MRRPSGLLCCLSEVLMRWRVVGQGISKQIQQGCPVYQLCQGAGAIVNYTHQDKTVTAAHFRQGAHAPPCL